MAQKHTSYRINLSALAFSAISIFGCAKTIRTVMLSNEIPEAAYCTEDRTYAGGYTFTGNATYEKPTITLTGLNVSNTTPLPIRHAEVRLVDTSGNFIDCTETDANGNFTLHAPSSGLTYTIEVTSRSFNNFNKASVLKDPVSNEFYSLKRVVVANNNQNNLDVIARADETIDSEIKAGAFNILDQIYNANDFLINNAGGFTVTKKVQAYWTRGLTPAVYVGGSDTDEVSFYIPGTGRLFILGGIDGDVSITDTDHFDDSVILHEYGHFIEDNYSKSDSPGGEHSGEFIVDPRLAWSEGFASFFSAIVISHVEGSETPIYRDTFGHTGGSTGFSYYYNMEINEDDYQNSLDNLSIENATYPSNLGEGIFREWAVARLLWDATDNTPDPEDVNQDGIINGADAGGTDLDTDPAMPFSEFWNIFTTTFKTTKAFRDMGHFLSLQSVAIGATDLTALLNADALSYFTIAARMTPSRLHYGTEDNPLTIDNIADPNCNWDIRARDQIGKPENGSFRRSNLFYSNDFYYVNHPGGVFTVNLVYNATTVNLDLYVYKENYEYGNGADMVTAKTVVHDGGSENISLYVPAGKYMVNVKYDTSNGGPFNSTTYNIKINNNLICR